MSTYTPPKQLNKPLNKQLKTNRPTLNILQLTDLHLSADKHKTVAGINCYDGFNNALKQALAEPIECDLILLTGDLVNEIKPVIYDYIFDKLQATGIPFACIAGNHDVTDVHNPNTPFEQREFIACTPDHRLLNQHCIESEHWQLLLINSSVAGKVYGEIAQAEQDWLTQQLSNNDKPAIIVMHHHAIPMDSAWIDKHIIHNADEFWATIAPFNKQVKAVLSGHTHQASEQVYQGVINYTTPSTGYQFAPKQTDFDYDESATAGYRWLLLHPDGSLASQVRRL